MIEKTLLQDILHKQKEAIRLKDAGMSRDGLLTIPDVKSFALIISGIRRCGKSTLLFQILNKKYADALYINFDDPRLYDFELSDFQKLDEIIRDADVEVLMFDEIQLINGWERYVRQKLDENFKVYVTGSNASLLSRELGTSLTGRHLTRELFPFSYSEFCRFRARPHNELSVKEFMLAGGFPEFLKTNVEDILSSLLDDILYRDIAVRYGIRDTVALKRLTIYLLSNVGNLTSANKLREPSSIKSTTTILEYMSHLEQSYLLSFVPMFDYSLKKQTVNPKKIYAIDLGLVSANVPKSQSDIGHRLENAVYNSLRLNHKEIFYHKGKAECDFVIMEKGAITTAIQVCTTITPDNRARELNGLIEALEMYNLNEGTIVTLAQDDFFEINGLKIRLVPSYEFLK